MNDYQLGFRHKGRDIQYMCSAESMVDAINQAEKRLEEQGYQGATLVWGRSSRGLPLGVDVRSVSWSPKVRFELSEEPS